MPVGQGAEILLLETKFYIPKWRPEMVSRPQLLARLHQGSDRKLTLVSASAGFGKTTLLAEWVAAVSKRNRPVAWVSLDRADNDSTYFWTYVFSALQKIQLEAGEQALEVLRSPQPPPIETILTTAINDIDVVETDFTLVLDDYHAIESQLIHEAISFLLDRMPPQMHLLVATRSEPPWPLARLRVRGELTELRAADLRFTPAEAAMFLNRVMKLDVSTADVAGLEQRTEGWIAGLQLAALSMQGREDASEFVADFSGGDRHIVDYLLEEVLQRQSERVRNFLLQTSVLDRLSGSLCDAVTEESRGKDMLETLERSNLFVVSLDDKRQWYRYHHLFADVLRTRLQEEQRDRLSLLHARASEWYEQNELPTEAIHHALAAEDFARAANLVELAGPTMRQRGRESTLLAWMQALPEDLARTRPVLSVLYANALQHDGELEAAEARLQAAERCLERAKRARQHSDSPEMVVADEMQFRSLPAAIANARAFSAQALGDISGTVAYTRQALSLLPEGDYYERGTTAALLGLAYWASGKLEAARQSFADGAIDLHKAGGIQIRLGGSIILADIDRACGRLREAICTYENALQLAATYNIRKGTAELHLGLSQLHLERGDRVNADRHFQKAEALHDRWSLPGFRYFWGIVRAREKEVRGDLGGAIALLHEAERLYYRSPLPDVRPIAAVRARVWVKQGNLAEALGWVSDRDLSVDDDLSYLREYEHVTLARVLIAQYERDRQDRSIQQAFTLLERLLEVAEAGERTGSILDILVVQTLADRACGRFPEAIASLERALKLAEPEGYVQIFVDAGASVVELLKEIAKRDVIPNYARRLLAEFEDARSPGSQPVQALLSDRELDVLRLLRTELSGPEIARELTVSLNTMRTHTKNIYSKLGANNRRAAIRCAEELNLF
ncbi:MAG: LuxR C-terminal-related transcriptional regulator [Cyanobacteria bacterium J06642_2]